MNIQSLVNSVSTFDHHAPASLPSNDGSRPWDSHSHTEPAGNCRSTGSRERSFRKAPLSPSTSKRTSLPFGAVSSPNLGFQNTRDMVKPPDASPGVGSSWHATPSSPPHARERRPGCTNTPITQTAPAVEWTVDEVANRLKTYRQDVRDGHAQLTAYIIESTEATERRVFHGDDLFSGVNITAVPKKEGTTMRMKFKQHIRNKRDQREEHFVPVCIKTNIPSVPPYRFHQVEIRKNILSPHTMLTFVPHLRDLESSEEVKYNLWLKELEDIDLKSGFKPMNREEKQSWTAQSERAATISLYLDGWLDRLAIPNCNKSTLIRYMASQEPDETMTPQQKSNILKSHRDSASIAPGAIKTAAMFTAAFRLAFKDGQQPSKQVDLRRVLLLDESVDSIMDAKPTAKDGSHSQYDNEDERVESNLATYCILGCLICFSHSCDHGEYDMKNLKRNFSMSSCSSLSDVLRRRRLLANNTNTNSIMTLDDTSIKDISSEPCQRACYRLVESTDQYPQQGTWSEEECTVLRSLYVTAMYSRIKKDPICLAANFLDRNCFDVRDQLLSLKISLPSPEPTEPARPKNLSWYDRRRKMLLGDWQDHTLTHEHQRREIIDPCFHDGPCAPKICSCVDAGVLCEKFCGCNVEDCAYKFTGCACHSQGKTCYSKQKDKPCICVQLNRECDPSLCGTCGALERADPENSEDIALHATGCQNCDLQRGLHRPLLLGQSQLEGVGYGLYTAEDIVQDEFIIEYVGELITHDEGVRREARRGDVFDEESNISYVFTLLENEGIWVDAAIYGNLSRYINHASEHDTHGCNIMPRILYVNGEYRIKFTAMKDIKAGEELFFNYGENFPNLTKKLLDHKAGETPQTSKGKGRRPGRQTTSDRVARKVPKTEQKNIKKRKESKREKQVRPESDEDKDMIEEKAEQEALENTRKRKRQFYEESDEEEYMPTGTDATSHAAESSIDSEEQPPGSKRLRKKPRQLKPKPPGTPSKSRNPPKTRGKRGGARPGSGRPRKHPRPDTAPLVPTPPAASTRDNSPVLQPATATTTPRQDKNKRKPDVEVIEIEDSEDQEDVMVRGRTPRNRRPPAKFRDDEVFG